MSITKKFIEQSIRYLNENVPRIEKCLHELDEKDVWQRPNASSNSVGNLILHVSGNMRQYIISSLGHNEDKRNRAAEFSATGGFSKAELLGKIRSTVKEACDVLNNVTEDELLRIRVVQGFEMSGVDIVVHVTEHFSYHTGQIVFWTKLLKDKDLEFYKGKDLNKTNS
jgi:uncharacterized damage-inducible protein DinB